MTSHPKLVWDQLNNTSVLLQEFTEHLLPEWHPVAMVMRRQIYEAQPPKWHALIGTNMITAVLFGRYDTLEEAMSELEAAVRAS